MRTNEIFTLESRELNEGKKVAFIAGGINRDINKVNLNDKMKSIGEHTQYFPLVVVDGEDVVKEGLCDASMTEDYSAIMYSLDRIVDNCVSIAEETLDHLSFVNFSEDEADEERPADIIAEIDAEETLEEHENSEPKENANASDTDDADNSSNTAINKATDFS